MSEKPTIISNLFTAGLLTASLWFYAKPASGREFGLNSEFPTLQQPQISESEIIKKYNLQKVPEGVFLENFVREMFAKGVKTVFVVIINDDLRYFVSDLDKSQAGEISNFAHQKGMISYFHVNQKQKNSSVTPKYENGNMMKIGQ